METSAQALRRALSRSGNHRRLLQLQGLDAALLVERFSGEEAVCGENKFQIECLSTDGYLHSDPWLGTPVTLLLELADRSQRQWHGLCSWVGELYEADGLARYEVHIEPWTCLLQLRRNCRVFHDLDVRGICERIFSGYVPARFRFDVQQALLPRALTIQYRETDWEFVSRLLADAGLAWRIEQAQGETPADTLVVFDPHAVLPQRGALHFVRTVHGSRANVSGEAITHFSEHFETTPNASTVASWDSAQLRAVSGHDRAFADNALPPLEVFSMPRAGRFPRSADAEAAARASLDALQLAGHYFSGAGDVRCLAAGHGFRLPGHDLHAEQAFQLLRVRHEGSNNLGQEGAHGSYHNRFVAVTAEVPVRPMPRDRPTVHGPMTAHVVGLPDAAVTANRDHQVLIRFSWQREHGPGDTGIWAPVVEWLAGPNWGTHFLPRIGSEVLVEFEHGDIDQPRIVGQLYNGQVPPPFGGGMDEQAAHPGVLSGVHSQSHDGSGQQQWVIDDSTGQLRTRLHTAQADSGLELGYLIAHHHGSRGAYRGEGFELATKGWGNVHAAQGVLLSTTRRDGASSTQLDVHEAVAQIKGAERSLGQMHELLQAQRVPGLTGHARTQQLREQIDPAEQGRHPERVGGQKAVKPAAGRVLGDAPVEAFARPLLLAESPHHIGWTTPATAAVFAGQHLQLTVQQDLQITAGETLSTVSAGQVSLFAQQGPLKAVAAKGPLSLQAHAGELELLAAQDLTITATDERVDVLAQESIVLQAGNCRITLDRYDITIEAPGEFLVRAQEHPFLGPEAGTTTLYPLPVARPAVSAERTLHSTFAYEQLREIAERSTRAEFVMMLAPTFGFDLPASVYIDLQRLLKEGDFPIPEHRVMSGGHYPAAYDNMRREILVHALAADQAAKTICASRELLAVLLHEFGHHVDAVLRQDLAPKQADGSPSVAADSPAEEGEAFARMMAVFDVSGDYRTEYAQYRSPGYSGPLSANHAEVQQAVRARAEASGPPAVSSDGRFEGFSAGDGQNHARRPEGSFGHRSIEDVLKRSGFEDDEVSLIYFGNWLRDYSQLLDPKVVRPADAAKDFGRFFSRPALTAIVDILATGEFAEQRSREPASFRVTPERLGVYRPSEHIDNPRNITPSPADPRSIDADFEPWVLPGDPLLSIDPDLSMKRYILRSKDHMVAQIRKAQAQGKNADGFRTFGGALHVLEDYFAHSNFCELALRKLGHTAVLPWTSPAPCRHRYPVVTGMFGPTDVIASLAEPIAHALFNVESWTFEARNAGDRSDGEKIMLVLLSEHSDPRYLKAFEDFLNARDALLRLPGRSLLSRIGWIASAPMRLVLNCYNLVYQNLMLLLGNSVDDVQTMAESDPNTDGSTDPTHSQLAKDHDDHPLHTLAAKLAMEAVAVVGQEMVNRWSGDVSYRPAEAASAFILHPFDSDWQDELVRQWALENPAAVRRAGSATELEHLHELHGKAALDELRRVGSFGAEGWDYMQRSYEILFDGKDEEAEI